MFLFFFLALEGGGVGGGGGIQYESWIVFVAELVQLAERWST